MEMHQVRYFLAVARTLNFTRAAEESNVTQPSLTRAIQKLEEEFGGLLFRRERALTHLTDLGRMMLPHLERTYEAAQAAKNLAKGVGKAVVAPLNLGIAATLRGNHLHQALRHLAEQLPGLQLRLVSGEANELVDALLKGDIDMLVLGERKVMSDRIDTMPLFDQHYALAVPDDHELAANDQADVADLGEVTLVEYGSDVLEEFRDHCTSCAITAASRHSAVGEKDVVQLVAAGLGCGIVSRDVSLPEGVAMVELADLQLLRKVVLASVAGRQRSPAAEAFMRSLRVSAWA